jgi:hypothetical protein
MESAEWFKSTFNEEVYDIGVPLTVVIGTPWSTLKEEHVQLLSKILVAVGQSLGSVRVIHQEAFDMSLWSEKPARVIAFVAPPKGLAAYEIIQGPEGAVVFSDPLEILNADDGAKRKLWGTLKTLFQS